MYDLDKIKKCIAYITNKNIAVHCNTSEQLNAIFHRYFTIQNITFEDLKEEEKTYFYYKDFRFSCCFRFPNYDYKPKSESSYHYNKGGYLILEFDEFCILEDIIQEDYRYHSYIENRKYPLLREELPKFVKKLKEQEKKDFFSKNFGLSF